MDALSDLSGLFEDDSVPTSLPFDIDDLFDDNAVPSVASPSNHDFFIEAFPHGISNIEPGPTSLPDHPMEEVNEMVDQYWANEPGTRQDENPTTSNSHGSVNNSGSQGATHKSNPANGKASAGGIRLTGPGKASRWKKTKGKFGSLQHQLYERQMMQQEMTEENHRLRLRARALEHAVASREQQMSIWARFNQAKSMGQTASKEAQELVRLASAPFASMSPKLCDFVGTTSMLLLRLADASDPEGKEAAGSDVASQVAPFCSLMSDAFVLNPRIQISMLTQRVDSGSSGLPAPGHWESVAEQLNLTQAQMEDVQATWDLYKWSMVKLQQQVVATCGSPSGATEQNLALSAIMSKENTAFKTLCFTLFSRIFTSIQLARCIVHAFPFFPNARDIITSLLGPSSKMEC